MADPRRQDARVRVLHVISEPAHNGFFELLGRHADQSRFELRFCHLGGEGPMPLEVGQLGFDAFSLEADRRWSYGRAAAKLARRLRADRLDVVQTHLLDGSIVGLLSARLARLPVAIFTGHHSHEIPLHGRYPLTAVDRLCVKLSDRTVAPSAQMRATFLDVHGARPDKVELIHHGLELDRFDPTRVDRQAVRAELGLEDRLVIGSIGRFFWIKNQEPLLRAFAALAPETPDATLVLLGGGDKTAVQNSTRDLGIGDRVVLLDHQVDIARLIAAFDLFVHPALAESFGLVILEAMAMARPVVSTPVGIAPEVIAEGESGFLASSGDVAALTAALRRALADRERWEQVGQAARQRALGFPAAKMVHHYEELYTRLLGDRRR